MIKTKIVMKEMEEIVSIICDVCKKEYGKDDWQELDEFTHLNLEGGYFSVWGDGFSGSLNICQYCLKEMMGKYIQDKEEQND